MRIGILREGKTPPDNRVVLSPKQSVELLQKFPGTEIIVQPSDHRCYKDEEYVSAGLNVQEDLKGCDVLVGVKEVPVDLLLPGKTYFMFSHTIKKQPGNQKLIRTIVKDKITLVDYECITDDQGNRLIAFGRFAGIVGAHNGLLAYGRRTGLFQLGRVKDCKDYNELRSSYGNIQFPPMKIVVTGTGRVASGAVELLDFLKIQRVTKEEYLGNDWIKAPVYTQLKSDDLYSRISDGGYDRREFHAHPELYQCDFKPYTQITDLMMNCVFWKKGVPPFFRVHDIHLKWFHIQTIADISCDIEGSVPITIRGSHIDEPVYGIDKNSHRETEPYISTSIDIMAVDNLPNELPRDASKEFGDKFMNLVFPELLKEKSDMIERATIVKNGTLTAPFDYLEDYAAL